MSEPERIPTTVKIPGSNPIQSTSRRSSLEVVAAAPTSTRQAWHGAISWLYPFCFPLGEERRTIRPRGRSAHTARLQPCRHPAGSALSLLLLGCALAWSATPAASTADPKWQFIEDYAPHVWLAKDEKYFPSTIDYVLENTKPESFGGQRWVVTKQKLPSPSDILPFFHGIKPGDPAWPPPVYAFVLPGENQPGLHAVANPATSTLRVVYFTFYPYNRGKEAIKTMWGNHVSDIEKCYITFVNAKPESMTCAVHSWGETKKWADVTKIGKHPIVYAAWGSHGLYFTPGHHVYNSFLGLADDTSAGSKWETWANLQVVLPDQWHQLTSSAPGWTGVRYIVDVLRWGNPHQGTCMFGECQLNDGPTGFLNKGEIAGIIAQLDRNVGGGGWTTCAGGTVSADCPWPAGIWSARTDLHCLPGYYYVAALKQCFIQPYTGAKSNCGEVPAHCSSKDGSCGPAWRAHSHGNCALNCYSDCIASKVGDVPSGAPAHNVCGLDGQWISFAEFKNLPDDRFNFNNGFGAGTKEEFNCTPPVCAAGFQYSPTTKNCYLMAYRSGARSECPSHCRGKDGSCGPGWRDHSHGNCAWNCYSDCIVSTSTEVPAGGPTHYACGLDGKWHELSEVAKNENNFNFNNGSGAGRKEQYSCSIP